MDFVAKYAVVYEDKIKIYNTSPPECEWWKNRYLVKDAVISVSDLNNRTNTRINISGILVKPEWKEGKESLNFLFMKYTKKYFFLRLCEEGKIRETITKFGEYKFEVHQVL